jgi:aminodeoxyfutalosine synthase
MTGSFSDLAQKAASGQALAPADARRLAETPDLVTVGMVATEARRARVGNGVTYVRVMEIEHGGPGSGPGASVPEPIGDVPDAARELRISGMPESIGEAAAWVSRAVAAAGDRPVSGFSLAQIWALAEGDLTAVQAFARTLRQAGATAIAEVAVDDLPLEALRPALDALLAGGLLAPVASFRNAPADPIAAFYALRQLQAEGAVFRAVAPLPKRRLSPSEAPSTGYDDVKLVALARVILDNVDHVQVDWATHGPKLAQVALLFGASDLDRVSPSDDAPLGHRRAPIEEVQRNITAAFLEPIERDGRFERVAR